VHPGPFVVDHRADLCPDGATDVAAPGSGKASLSRTIDESASASCETFEFASRKFWYAMMITNARMRPKRAATTRASSPRSPRGSHRVEGTARLINQTATTTTTTASPTATAMIAGTGTVLRSPRIFKPPTDADVGPVIRSSRVTPAFRARTVQRSTP